MAGFESTTPHLRPDLVSVMTDSDRFTLLILPVLLSVAPVILAIDTITPAKKSSSNDSSRDPCGLEQCLRQFPF